MTNEADRREQQIPPPPADPGMRAVDDHAMADAPRGRGQDADGLDRGVGDEHVTSASQGVRPETNAGTDPGDTGPDAEPTPDRA